MIKLLQFVLEHSDKWLTNDTFYTYIYVYILNVFL